MLHLILHLEFAAIWLPVYVLNTQVLHAAPLRMTQHARSLLARVGSIDGFYAFLCLASCQAMQVAA
jgi:hypothetical protein